MKKTMMMLAVAVVLTLASCTAVRPIAVTSNPVGNKCGEASVTKVFGIGSGNNGINAAAKQGGITQISHVDYAITTHLFGLIQTYTTRVYGE